MTMTTTPHAAAQEGARAGFYQVLMKLYRISGAELAPDGKHFLYSRSLPNLAENSIRSNEIVVGTTDAST